MFLRKKIYTFVRNNSVKKKIFLLFHSLSEYYGLFVAYLLSTKWKKLLFGKERNLNAHFSFSYECENHKILFTKKMLRLYDPKMKMRK